MQVIASRAEIVVDEDSVRLAVILKFGSDLLRMLHAVRHAQAVGCEITEAAAVVASAGSDEAGSGEKAVARKNFSARRRIVAIVAFVSRNVAQLQRVCLDVAEDARPELHARTESEGSGGRRTFVRARENMQTAEDHLRSAGSIPVGEFIRAFGERQMHRNADNIRHGMRRRPTVEQVLVPIFDAPVRGRSRGEAGERECRRQDVLAEAGVRVLGIEGINQERIVRLERAGSDNGIKRRRNLHFKWNPAFGNRAKERLVRAGHYAMYFTLQSTSSQHSYLLALLGRKRIFRAAASVAPLGW